MCFPQNRTCTATTRPTSSAGGRGECSVRRWGCTSSIQSTHELESFATFHEMVLGSRVRRGVFIAYGNFPSKNLTGSYSIFEAVQLSLITDKPAVLQEKREVPPACVTPPETPGFNRRAYELKIWFPTIFAFSNATCTATPSPARRT
jgi:hypothetical protein